MSTLGEHAANARTIDGGKAAHLSAVLMLLLVETYGGWNQAMVVPSCVCTPALKAKMTEEF